MRLNDRSFTEVDEYLETSVPGVNTMGDVKGGPAFTHISYDDYRILHANLIGHEKASTRDRIVPYAMFIDPQLGRVGMTVSLRLKISVSVSPASITCLS
jgi:pyruvate/2-oxoglutarate dehydrogenase complex dihydrolipoamide dehydrogenase (E3) component